MSCGRFVVLLSCAECGWREKIVIFRGVSVFV